MDAARRSPLRILAPLALVVFAAALVLVVANTGGSSGGGGGATATEKARDLGPTAAQKRRAKRRKAKTGSGSLPQNVYVVKSGDTLGGIAERTGVPVAKLQSLNPGLDQFSLRTGQRIQLR